MKRYNPSEIEPKWQRIWEEKKAYEVEADSSRPKTYASGMFPYPSGAGMHTGHAFSWAIVDAISRFDRQHGFNVLNPMGWDTFGLPAENYAIKTGTAPAVATATNIANFKNQFKRMGVSIDWSREINTSDPEYYRWTQWIFTQLFNRGLAYQKESLQWWCDIDKTVLANEQVINGKCWRHDGPNDPPAVKKFIKQWFFKITEYADALLDEIPDLDWPEKIKTMQTNWIGRSQGAEVQFQVDGSGPITVFTTRPDTIFGATFLVVAPEHPDIRSLLHDSYTTAAEHYIKDAVKKTEIDRQNDTKEKTGVFTGSYAINPATGEKIPIWVADYVLGSYGTGAIVAVPAHDERDNEFAQKFDLPIKQVVAWDWKPSGVSAPREGVETIQKETIDAIIHDGNGNYLLQIEQEGDIQHVHFVGGGVDPEDENAEATVRREVIEETGLTNITLIKQVSPLMSAKGYRHTKDKNQHGIGAFYEVVVDPTVQIESEIETGKHSVRWVSKDEVADQLSWEHHQWGWDKYIHEDNFHHGEGVLVNSGEFTRVPTAEAREKIVAWLEDKGVGSSKITYKMRDWLISRQRYWGAPIPIIHCPDHGAVAVPEDQLPVVLPEIEDYAPRGDGKSALAHVAEWVNTTCPTCGNPATRETDTMDGYACSSWYLLRFADPHDNQQAWDPALANYWSPVDYYVGGDHAVAHLLYVRFWTHVFHEMGLVSFKEPVKKLIYHGYINAEDGSKMSKSKGNVIDPLDVIDQGYGADALRTYVLFMGPIELDASWDSRGIGGVFRFLNRVWTLTQDYLASDKSFDGNDENIRRAQHKTVRKVTNDFRRQSFNTSISALMEYVNELYKYKIDGYSEGVWRDALDTLVQCIAPLAPHMAEELWADLGHDTLIHETMWPAWDDAFVVDETVTVIVQVNGKLRAKLELAKDTPEEDIKKAAIRAENVQAFLDGKDPVKVIYVPGKLVNLVVK